MVARLGRARLRLPPQAGGGGGDYAYFEMLASHEAAVLTKAFTSSGAPDNDPQQQVDNTYLVTSSGAYDAGRWAYDDVMDAIKLTWGAEEESLVTGSQLRWGDTTGYNEEVPAPFGVLGTSTFLFVWDWRFSSHWAISERNMGGENVLSTHKAFQFSENGNLTLEPRFRYTSSSAQFAAPTGNQVCHLDFRTYEGGGGAAGDGVPQDATVFPEAEQWFRIFVFLDGANLELSYWAHLDDGDVVQMIDQATGFATTIQGIEEFWFELNTSQDGGSGISQESYMWGRNWVVLEGLTLSEAEALVAQSSW